MGNLVDESVRLIPVFAGHSEFSPDSGEESKQFLAAKIPRLAVFVCEHVDASAWALPETPGRSLRRSIPIVLRHRNAGNGHHGNRKYSDCELQVHAFLLLDSPAVPPEHTRAGSEPIPKRCGPS